jgi:hypothetical protein
VQFGEADHWRFVDGRLADLLLGCVDTKVIDDESLGDEWLEAGNPREGVAPDRVADWLSLHGDVEPKSETQPDWGEGDRPGDEDDGERGDEELVDGWPEDGD